MTESRPENSKASSARGTGALLQIWEKTWFLSRVFVPICGTRPPDHPHMVTETRCHNRKARICEAQAGVFAMGGRDIRRGHRVQGGTTGPETSAHSLRALGTSPKLVQPFPSRHSCLSVCHRHGHLPPLCIIFYCAIFSEDERQTGFQRSTVPWKTFRRIPQVPSYFKNTLQNSHHGIYYSTCVHG